MTMTSINYLLWGKLKVKQKSQTLLSGKLLLHGVGSEFMGQRMMDQPVTAMGFLYLNQIE